MLNLISKLFNSAQKAFSGLSRFDSLNAQDWVWSDAIDQWNADFISKEYGFNQYHSEVVSRSYISRQDFESEVKSHQKEFDVTYKQAVNTLKRWAVEYEQTCDLDQIIWDENNRLTGADCQM